MHAGIIGHTDHHAGVDPGIGNGKQRVGGHIDPHMLHHTGTALACQRGAKGHLHGHLFIGGPLAVNLVILGRLLGDLRAGGAGITGNQAAAGLIESPGHRRIAQHQFLHWENPFPGCPRPDSAGRNCNNISFFIISFSLQFVNRFSRQIFSCGSFFSGFFGIQGLAGLFCGLVSFFVETCGDGFSSFCYFCLEFSVPLW